MWPPGGVRPSSPSSSVTRCRWRGHMASIGPFSSAEFWETFALCWPEGLMVILPPPPPFSRPLRPSWEIFSFNTVDCRHPERASAYTLRGPLPLPFMRLSWTLPPPQSGGQVAFRLEPGGDCGTLADPCRRAETCFALSPPFWMNGQHGDVLQWGLQEDGPHFFLFCPRGADMWEAPYVKLVGQVPGFPQDW